MCVLLEANLRLTLLVPEMLRDFAMSYLPLSHPWYECWYQYRTTVGNGLQASLWASCFSIRICAIWQIQRREYGPDPGSDLIKHRLSNWDSWWDLSRKNPHDPLITMNPMNLSWDGNSTDVTTCEVNMFVILECQRPRLAWALAKICGTEGQDPVVSSCVSYWT